MLEVLRLDYPGRSTDSSRVHVGRSEGTCRIDRGQEVGKSRNVVDRGKHFVTVFTRTTWEHFVSSGGSVLGFRSNASERAHRLVEGDRLLGYVVDGVGFVGLLEVAAEEDLTDDTSWGFEDFPIKISVRTLISLPLEAAIPVTSLIRQLPRLFAANQRQPGAWEGFFRGAPKMWPRYEAEVVESALSTAALQLTSQRSE